MDALQAKQVAAPAQSHIGEPVVPAQLTPVLIRNYSKTPKTHRTSDRYWMQVLDAPQSRRFVRLLQLRRAIYVVLAILTSSLWLVVVFFIVRLVGFVVNLISKQA